MPRPAAGAEHFLECLCVYAIGLCGEQLLREGVVSRCSQTGPTCEWLCRADASLARSTPRPATPSIAKRSSDLSLLGPSYGVHCMLKKGRVVGTRPNRQIKTFLPTTLRSEMSL